MATPIYRLHENASRLRFGVELNFKNAKQAKQKKQSFYLRHNMPGFASTETLSFGLVLRASVGQKGIVLQARYLAQYLPRRACPMWEKRPRDGNFQYIRHGVKRFSHIEVGMGSGVSRLTLAPGQNNLE